MAPRQRSLLTSVVLSFFALAAGPQTSWADPPKILELRVQKVGQTTFFHVRFETPADLSLPGADDRLRWWSELDMPRLPRLVPQDGKTKAIYLRVIGDGDNTPVPPNNKEQPPFAQNPPSRLRVENLEFLGQVQGDVPAQLLLFYPSEPKGKADPKEKRTLAKILEERRQWVEAPVTLDFAKAKKVEVPASALKRSKAPAWPDANDIEGLWAAMQGRYFSIMEGQTPEFGFYGIAREMTARKYSVPAPDLGRFGGPADIEIINRRLYEITTGAAAITESLAMNRLRNPNGRNKQEARSVDITAVQGVDIAEHPWEKMMAGKKPAPEPTAKIVPNDNYYVHFKNIAKFLDVSDLLDQWGTNLARIFEVSSRDFQLKERIEQQLCLKNNKLARIFGPAFIKSLTITGSDPYLKEGSDITIIFRVTNKALFLGGVEPYLKEAKKTFGDKLKEDRQTYQEIAIESYRTPLREVSMHRASFDDFVIYSNSPVGIRRIIDTYKGKMKSLGDSLDFQYMRTVFRHEDPAEDGFVFLSDPFIRNLVGPATRIKERRRLEALTSMAMVNHGALFTAWETGQLPAHHNQLLAYTGLKADELFSPDGDGIFWSGDYKQAFSNFYNTLNFATPLIEIPLDKVTPAEQAEYEVFRQQYLGIWRQYFDPIGIRIGIDKKEVRWETYILPLVKTTQYDDLRRLAGDGTIKIDPRMFNEKTIFQLLTHLSPNARERKEFGKILSGFSRDIPGLNWLGDWATIRLDDSAVYGKIMERMLLRELEPRSVSRDWDEDVRLFFQLPLTAGVEIRNPLVFAGVLAAVKRALTDALPGAIDWEPLKEPYKKITIVQIKARPEAGLNQALGGNRKGEPLTPSLYYALIDGAWFISFREECIRDEIDSAILRRQEKEEPAKVEINSTVYVGAKGAEKTKEFLRSYLEWETQRRAVANAYFLYPLYHGKIITAADDGNTVQNAALKYLGFVPVSPDYSPYLYDMKTDEVVNRRHGSPQRPLLQPTLDPISPLASLLEMFRTLRADLRFREDGVHTLVTFERK